MQFQKQQQQNFKTNKSSLPYPTSRLVSCVCFKSLLPKCNFKKNTNTQQKTFKQIQSSLPYPTLPQGSFHAYDLNRCCHIAILQNPFKNTILLPSRIIFHSQIISQSNHVHVLQNSAGKYHVYTFSCENSTASCSIYDFLLNYFIELKFFKF